MGTMQVRARSADILDWWRARYSRLFGHSSEDASNMSEWLDKCGHHSSHEHVKQTTSFVLTRAFHCSTSEDPNRTEHSVCKQFWTANVRIPSVPNWEIRSREIYQYLESRKAFSIEEVLICPGKTGMSNRVRRTLALDGLHQQQTIIIAESNGESCWLLGA